MGKYLLSLNGSLRRYPDQTVDFVQAVIGDTDGHVRFKLSKDIVSMESHIIPDYRKVQSSEQIIQVDSYSVASFARKYKVPRNFGILSIDAEGAGSKVSLLSLIAQWCGKGLVNLGPSSPTIQKTIHVLVFSIFLYMYIIWLVQYYPKCLSMYRHLR